MERIDTRNPVNWRHPLNRGRVAWWLSVPSAGWAAAGALRDLCRRVNCATAGATPWTPGQNGFGATDFNGAGGYATAGVMGGSLLDRAGSTGVALAATVLVRSYAGGVNIRTIAGAGDGAGPAQYFLRLGDAGSPTMIRFIANIGGQKQCIGGVLALGRTYRVLGLSHGTAAAGSLRVYVDGALSGTLTGFTGTFASTPTTPFLVGANDTGGGRPWDGPIGDVSVWGDGCRGYSDPDAFAAADYRQWRRGHPDALNRLTRAWSFGTPPAPPPVLGPPARVTTAGADYSRTTTAGGDYSRTTTAGGDYSRTTTGSSVQV